MTRSATMRRRERAVAQETSRLRQVHVPVQDQVTAIAFVKSFRASRFVGFSVHAAGSELLKFDCCGVLEDLPGHFHVGTRFEGHPGAFQRIALPDPDPRRQIEFGIHFYAHYAELLAGLHQLESVRALRIESGNVEASCEAVENALDELLPLASADCFPPG